MALTADSLVVDASVATKWYLRDEADADLAAELLVRYGRREVQLVATQQIRYEVVSAITVATRVVSVGQRQSRLTVAEGAQSVADFLGLDLPTIDDDQLVLAAYDIAQKYGCAFYDSLYLALAERLEFPLILADRRFYALIRHLPHAIWLGDYDGLNP